MPLQHPGTGKSPAFSTLPYGLTPPGPPGPLPSAPSAPSAPVAPPQFYPPNLAYNPYPIAQPGYYYPNPNPSAVPVPQLQAYPYPVPVQSAPAPYAQVHYPYAYPVAGSVVSEQHSVVGGPSSPYLPQFPVNPAVESLQRSSLGGSSPTGSLSNLHSSLYPALPATPPPSSVSPAPPNSVQSVSYAAMNPPPPYYGGTPPASAPGPIAPLKPELPPTPVELIIAARNLLDRDTFSKSDPVCVLYRKELRTNEWVEIGRTEQIKNNLSPSWNKKFTVDYHFEERQLMKFAIYDWDSTSTSLAAHDFLGSVECSLGEIVAAPNKKFERNLTLPRQFGGKTSSIQIIAEELGSNKEVVHFKINGRKLDKKDFLGKSDPYIQIAKKLDDGTWFNVHKTEVIKNTLNPDWRPLSVRVASLTSGNPERPLRFQVYDWNSSGASDFIGEFETNYSHLLNASKSGQVSFAVINPAKKAKKKSYTSSGTINFEWLKIEEEKTFLDYIQSGVQLHFTVAVDFTASNGDPNHPQSLHYRNPNFDNQYSLAIKSVGEIIQDYDSDKLFPALGFGAKIPPTGQVSHEFYLNGNPESPFCHGVAGILEAYHRSLNTVQLYGPTYFAPVIEHVARFASTYQDGKNYFILLIITDGIICDMDATKEAIINASHLPMSIIIIGVGQEDFSAMEFLDSDSRLLRHNSKVAARDIVQFVELRKYLAARANFDSFYNKVSLSRAVLAELPDQLVLWMRKLKPVCP